MPFVCSFSKSKTNMKKIKTVFVDVFKYVLLCVSVCVCLKMGTREVVKQ